MSQIALALPYAVSIRDFVHSGSLDELVRHSQHRVVVYTLNPELPELQPVRDLGVEVHPLVPYKDSLPERALKSLYPLFFADHFAYVEQMLQQRPLRRLAAAGFVRLRRLLGTPLTLRLWSALLLAAYRLRSTPQQLHQPYDLLIGTRSLINSLDYGLIAEATTRGIPVLTIAGSWDNFTTKGFFPFPSRCTVVWNHKMRQELTELYRIDPAKIVIAGYPRAILLRSLVKPQDPGDYLASIGIAGYRRYVLYSASYGELTRAPGHAMPVEYQAIRRVCEQLVPQLPADTCVLIRMHPFSNQQDRDYFASLERCFVFVPGRQDRYVERVMNKDDEYHLAQQVASAACVVSMASTMTIDALCLERPVLNIAFDPIEGLPPQDSLRRFYGFNHFADLVRLAHLPLAHTLDDVARFVDECLNGRHVTAVDREAFESWYLGGARTGYAETLRDTIEAVLASGAAPVTPMISNAATTASPPPGSSH